MQFTRLEEYTHFENGLPFRLNTSLRRTATSARKIANWHENLEIQLCTDGEGWVLLNGERHAFQKGDIVVANSGVLHYTSTDSFLEYSCLIIDTAFCRLMGIDYETLYFSPLIKSEKLQTLFRSLIFFFGDGKNYQKVKLNSLVLQILCTLCEEHTVKQERENSASDYEKVKQVVRYVREHFGEKLSLDTLSKIALCDKYTLTRIFKKATGQTVTTYINRLRCELAANMLACGASVTEAALSCGFDNFSYFSKTFFAHMGLLPSKYKSRTLQKE